jgi:hypothetical protein
MSERTVREPNLLDAVIPVVSLVGMLGFICLFIR